MAMSRQEREALVEQYAQGPKRVREALGKVPDEARKWRPAPGKWSVHEVVVHCADAETNAAMRLRYLLAEKDPVIVGYDQAEWARLFDYHNQPIEESLAAAASARARTLPLLKRMTDAEWAKEGKHTESGRYTAEDWLRVYAAHLEGHAKQIERNLEGWKARG